MKNEKISLTVSEAIAQGFTFCTPRHGYEVKLIPIEECDFKTTYNLLDKEVAPFAISNSLLYELLDQYLEDQEDVEDESGTLNRLVADVDYSAVTAEINEKLSAVKYYHPTEIYLIP